MTDSKEDGTMTPKHFTEDEKFALAAAARGEHITASDYEKAMELSLERWGG